LRGKSPGSDGLETNLKQEQQANQSRIAELKTTVVDKEKEVEELQRANQLRIAELETTAAEKEKKVEEEVNQLKQEQRANQSRIAKLETTAVEKEKKVEEIDLQARITVLESEKLASEAAQNNALAELRRTITTAISTAKDMLQVKYDNVSDPEMPQRLNEVRSGNGNFNLLLELMDRNRDKWVDIQPPLFTHIKKRSNTAHLFIRNNFKPDDLLTFIANTKAAYDTFYNFFRVEFMFPVRILILESEELEIEAFTDLDESITAPPDVNRALRQLRSVPGEMEIEEMEIEVAFPIADAFKDKLVRRDALDDSKMLEDSTLDQTGTTTVKSTLVLNFKKLKIQSGCPMCEQPSHLDAIVKQNSRLKGIEAWKKTHQSCHIWWVTARKYITLKETKVDGGAEPVYDTFERVIPYLFYNVLTKTQVLGVEHFESRESTVEALEGILKSFVATLPMLSLNYKASLKDKRVFTIKDRALQLEVVKEWGAASATLGKMAIPYVELFAKNLVAAMISKMKDDAFCKFLETLTAGSFFNAIFFILTNDSIWNLTQESERMPPISIFFDNITKITELKTLRQNQ
jgi:hypothetical protein